MDGGLTMGTAKHIGRVGALAVALGVGNFRAAAARVTVSIGVATVVVAATVVPAPVSTVSPTVALSADSTALILGGTSGPTPDDVYIEIVKNQYIAPTHPGQDIDYVPVTAPMELWPLTGVARLIGLAVGDPRLFSPGGPAWPDEPLWKLSGLFDLTADQSVQAGVADLEAAMAEHPNGHLVIYGYSQGAGVANVEKRKLAEQYPTGTPAPDIDFVLSGDPNLPNGGVLARFPGLYIPILDFSFNGAARTDSQFDTVEINRQYDGFTDFPLYPLNLLADLNAVLGIAYVHTNLFDVSLPTDPTTSPAYQGTHGDTSYYFFENPDLPLFGPLRTLGVPEALIDVVEPFFRAIVKMGYDRSNPPWEPTPARLLPPLDPGKVTADLVSAVGEGIDNALALLGSPPALHPSEASETARQDTIQELTSSDKLTKATRTSTESAPQQISMGSESTEDVIETAMTDDTLTGSLEVADAEEDSTIDLSEAAEVDEASMEDGAEAAETNEASTGATEAGDAELGDESSSGTSSSASSTGGDTSSPHSSDGNTGDSD
jgi:hypothetical protein